MALLKRLSLFVIAPLAVVVIVPLAVVASIIGALTGGAKRTRLEVAEDLEALADGRAGPWDWDDFTSVKLRDPTLDAIRDRVAELEIEYPPGEGDTYWNPAGVEVVREIARQLREAEA